MHPVLTPLPLLGRILIAAIFVLAGISQLGAIGATSANMASHGIPYPDYLVWGVVAFELVGGIMLIVGLLARPIALALFFYTLTLAVLFHPYWAFTGAAARTQHAYFYEHLAMMGGMMFVVAFGAGPFSLDALIFGRTRAQGVG